MTKPARMPERGEVKALLPRVEAIPRRGLRREAAAMYVGVSPSKFDEMVEDHRLPRPWRFDGCVVWDIKKLDAALDSLDDEGGRSEWD